MSIVMTDYHSDNFIRWLRHSAHRLGQSIGWAGVQFPGSAAGRKISYSDFRGVCFEINFSGRQRGFDGVLYNLWPLANTESSDAQ